MQTYHRLASTLIASTMLAACGHQAPPPADDVDEPIWREAPSLPEPISNNAVAALEVDGAVTVYSFLGIDSTKVWSGVRSSAFAWEVGTDAWRRLPDVPGPGRLASTAQVVGGRVYLLGGYAVAEDGAEHSVPNVDVYDPATGSWSRGADIPVPTDDAVSGVWRDSLIVLVSGWHDRGNVADVQLYDPRADRWSAGTPIPGPPVFGHSGSVVGDWIVYVDGTKIVDADPRFRIESSGWRGRIDPAHPEAITWEPTAPHPDAPLYRAAGGAVGTLVLLAGGTNNPYNYNGIGYDGRPSEPIRGLLGYDPSTDEWRMLPAPPNASMDHRTLGVAGGMVFLVGGMEAGGRVSDRVWWAEVGGVLGG
jgi:Kelch motif